MEFSTRSWRRYSIFFLLRGSLSLWFGMDWSLFGTPFGSDQDKYFQPQIASCFYAAEQSTDTDRHGFSTGPRSAFGGHRNLAYLCTVEVTSYFSQCDAMLQCCTLLHETIEQAGPCVRILCSAEWKGKGKGCRGLLYRDVLRGWTNRRDRWWYHMLVADDIFGVCLCCCQPVMRVSYRVPCRV